MSNYQAVQPMAGAPVQQAGMPKRPRVLIAFLLTTALAALLEIIGAVIVFAGGKKLAESNLVAAIDAYPEQFGMPKETSVEDLQNLGFIWYGMVDEYTAMLSARSILVVFFAAWLIIAGLFALYAARTARAFVTAGAVIGLFPHMSVITGYATNTQFVLSVCCVVLSVAAVVLCWLPPNNRFAKARRAGK